MDKCRNRGDSHDQPCRPCRVLKLEAQRRQQAPRLPHRVRSVAAVAAVRRYFTPAAGAKDLKSVLFNWAWYMGMLRSNEEYDVLMTLEYQGKGTMQVDGQPCNVTKYRTSISYRGRVSGSGSPAPGPTARAAPPSKSSAAGMPGTKTFPVPSSIAGKGKATPMPATVEERMIRLWAGPQGAWKAAMAGTVSNPTVE